MNLQAGWLLKGYFQIDDQMRAIRDSLAARLGLPAPSLQIAFYPARPIWKHTYWWREGQVDHAEAQFFARIAEECPVLTVGVSVEKGLEDAKAAPAPERDRLLMNRRTWDWPRLRKRIHELLKTDVPACASSLGRTLDLRFSARQYVRGQRTAAHERWTFVFLEGAWFQRYVGTATASTISERFEDLDKRKDWWANAYFGCDLFPDEVGRMTPDNLANILSHFSAIRRRLRSRNP